MIENEKELRRFIAERTYNESQENVGMSLLDGLLAAHRAALAAARAAALEEAARVVDCKCGSPDPDFERREGRKWHSMCCTVRHAERIRALASSPAPATIPVDRVRSRAIAALRVEGMLPAWRHGVASLADALGANVDDALSEPRNGAGKVGCCDLYGTPHQECRNAPEREPPLDATCSVCGGSWAIHRRDGTRVAWDGTREVVICAEFAGPAKQPPPAREPCGCVGGFVCAGCSGSGNADDA